MDEEKYGTKALKDYSDVKNWELWDAPAQEEIVFQTFPEFTCLCPRSGYPDFAKVFIISVPDKKVVELKCLKLWLNSFRNIGISHENMTQKVADTLFDTLGLKYVFVLMQYTPRGNLTTFPMTERINKDFKMRAEIGMIKKRLINQALDQA